MPFYDYNCADCGKKFEALHGMGGKPAGLKCESCGSTNIRRVFYAVSSLRSSAGDAAPTSASSSGGCHSCSSGACSTCR